MQVDGNSDSLSIHSQPPPVRPPQVPPENHLFFIIIYHIHMHKHIILLQFVDLTKHAPVVVHHRRLFAMKMAATACVARLCQGLHSTAIKFDHLLGRSAPRTYSTICISSESCLGSLVGFARLPCFGTLRSIPSAKVALGELLRLCPRSVGRAPQ